MICPNCKANIPDTSNFCGKCGAKLENLNLAQAFSREGKKQVTVFFSDVSGFTAMSEKLDAEEVKDIMQKIFSASAVIVKKYDGRIDKFIGDCVMAVFGIPQIHEDDAVRAIHAAMEIHEAVEKINTPDIGKRIGRKLSMHTGINTGIVVSGDLDIEKGSEKILGDTVNVASRLSSVAKQGEIVVGPDTYVLSDWHFEFEVLPPVNVKGKAKQLSTYKVTGHKKAADSFRRFRGRKAQFIGREKELNRLVSAAQAMTSGKGAIISISGDAGTGKSRLVSEYKSWAFAMGGYKWLEAFAYPHSENIAYSVWIDFINKLQSIEESDSKEQVRQKLEGIRSYHKGEDIVPILAVLYSIDYPETEGIDPGYLKMKITESIIHLIHTLAQIGKTIFCFDDLHWADPSSMEILRKLFHELDVPAVFLFIYRPNIRFNAEDYSGKGVLPYQEITLLTLDSANEERMIASLLNTDHVPRELLAYTLKKISGTPFYIEEIINNLIETKVLSFDDGIWKLTRNLTETDIPLSIQGVITARIDRLDPMAKRILQTASVIGQSFYYSLLKRTLELSKELDDCLELLESIDIIREETKEPDISYLFKHALLRDVVYESLLKKERGAIHHRVAKLMETVFKDRIEEFYETIAFHYQKSGNDEKAVEYLVKAGGKSMTTYATAEANNFYKQAYDILTHNSNRTMEENNILIKLLNDWGFTYYYLGKFFDWSDLFRKHIKDADSLADKGTCALFYAELGLAFDWIMEIDLSIKYQYEALRLAEESGDKRALAYAHCWLASQSSVRGHLAEGITHGDIGMKLAQELPEEPYLYAKSAFAKALCLGMRGNRIEADQISQIILEFGEARRNPRCLSLAYGAFACTALFTGNLNKAVYYFQKGSTVSQEPLYLHFSGPWQALALIRLGRFSEAEDVLKKSEPFLRQVRMIGMLTQADACHALFLIFQEFQYSKGFNLLKKIISTFEKKHWSYSMSNYNLLIGSLYLGMNIKDKKLSTSVLLRNLFFMFMTMPFMATFAGKFFKRSIEIARQYGIFQLHGRAALSLGILYNVQKKPDMAKKCLLEAIAELEKTDIIEDLEKAKAELQRVNMN